MGTFASTSAFSPGRILEAMVRTLGGGELILRLKGEPLIAGAATDPRLGLSSDTVEDITVGPVLCRELEDHTYEHTVPARVFEQHPELQQRGELEAVLESALGVMREDKLLRIVNVSTDMLANAPYLYRITVQE